MKLTLLFSFLVFSAAWAESYSQATKLSLDLKNASIKKFIQEVEDQTDFFFLYPDEVINNEKKITIHVKDKPLKNVLEVFEEQASVTAEITDNQIVLKNKVLKTARTVMQPNKQINGFVSDQDGQPLPGVTVVVKGTTVGTVTNADGEFSLSIPADAETLQFSFVGMKTQEIPVGDRTTFTIVMESEVIDIEEVVAIGYGTRKKINLTGSVDQITSKEFESMTVPNISRALQGQIPNLNITFVDGRPTSSPEYNIRGVTSIGAGGSALILIDGVEGDVTTLNPRDIESVSVLKDAASAAIYGARGAFGVVLITTKKPEREPQLNYTANFTINRRTATRDVLINSAEWAQRYYESYDNLYRGTRQATTIGDVGLLFSKEYVEELVWRENNPGHGKPEVGVDPATGQYLYYGETDWWDLLYKDNIPSMEHSVQASGGTAHAAYSISGRFYQQDGLYETRSDNYNNYSLRIQGRIEPTEWLNISSNMSYSSYDYTDPFEGSSIWNQMYVRCGATPMAVVRNPDGTLTKAGSLSVGILEDGIGYTKNSQGQVVISAAMEAYIIKNMLTLKGDFSYRNRTRKTDRKYVPLGYSNYPGVVTLVGDSRLWNNRNDLDYYAYNLYGDFNHNFGSNHSLQLVGGTNIEISNYEYVNVNRSELLIDELDALNLATSQEFGISGSGEDWANVGFFGRLNYQYKERYILEINARYDGSSKFPSYEQFGFFPSISVGWRISEENFMAGTRDWLDNLKPRFSYGTLGNSMISPYLFQERMGVGQTGMIIGDLQPVVTRPPGILPEDFTWEKSTTINVGLDIDILKNRFGAVFDWYQRRTYDMITSGPTLPAVLGAPAPKGNFADLETKGFELTLRWNDRINTRKPINYGIRLTLADNFTYITKYYNPNKAIITHNDQWYLTDYYEGMQIGELWGLTTEGLFKDQADIDGHADQSFILHNLAGLGPEPGDIKFKDLNGDNKIDWGNRTVDNPGDKSIIGNTAPRYRFGITLNADYSNFSLTTFFQGIAKRDWYPTHHQNPFWGPYGYWAAEIPRHFIEDGKAYYSENPDPDAYWPLWKGNMAYYNRQLQCQTRYLQNSAYIRLKELTLSYLLPKQISGKIGMDQLRLFFTGHNIWTYTPIFKITRDIDPEQMSEDAGKGDRYPLLKSYTLGLSVNF